MTPTPAEVFVDQLLSLLVRHGQLHYGEDVTQLEHALQTAHHAQADGADGALVAASLLHDIGHLIQKLGEDAADRGLDDRHEDIGAGYLARMFGPQVTEPIRLHVAAKRYLAAREPGYLQQLSRASLQSLALQGGPMSDAEAEAFRTQPTFAQAVRLRRYDELGKVVGADPAGLEAYRTLLVGLVQDVTQQR